MITLEYLRFHWGDVYVITRRGGTWTAVARFRDQDVLTADSADELSRMIWRHYPGLCVERRST
ncbi:MAG TPA: hypothetical protein VMU94_24100 [Streptosporangiaceae bacterium]|nr:hypothetical protein [Streptosporangiaceae bacterium]